MNKKHFFPAALLSTHTRFPYIRRQSPAVLIILTLLLAACSAEDLPFLVETPAPVLTEEVETVEPLPRAELKINLTVPADTPEKDKIYISFLDEVTGLALNSLPGEMERVDNTHFTTTTHAPLGSVLKYRYSRNGPLSNPEYSSNSLPVRYRIYDVQNPGVVEDTVARWQDTPYQWPTGRIKGVVTDSASQEPIPNILVAAGGLQTISAADGSYLLEGLPEGKHNLVAYAMDGAYSTFQQEAIVAEGSTTPAPLSMAEAPRVEVKFNVETPDGTPPGVPIIFAGNFSQFGNSFADLEGGLSSLPHRMPVLTALPDGGYEITLDLPVGADLRYKYTLGDGFWDAEMDPNGSFVLRQLIVSEETAEVDDEVKAWQAGENSPIWFDVNVPADTPIEDSISLQLNPYGWTQPLPMWRLDTNRWGYLLTSPLNLLETIGYRYCRNDHCGSADDVLTPGDSTGGRPLTMNTEAQTFNDTVDAWENYSSLDEAVTVPRTEIPERGDDYITGVELSTAFHPSWEPRLPNAMATIAAMNSGWVVLTPTWTFTQISPPALESVPGTDMLWEQLTDTANMAVENGFNVAIRPVPEFPFNAGDWWAAGERDLRWWDAWFERYQTFIMHNALAAEQTGAERLIIGGPEVAPALLGGMIGEETPSSVPPDADSRWLDLIDEVRKVYSGEIGWALEMNDQLAEPPQFLNTLDFVYVLWSVPLAADPSTDGADLVTAAGQALDDGILARIGPFDNQVIIALAYPSATGALTGCLTDPVEGDCLTEGELMEPNPPYHNLEINLDEQVEAYNAVLTAASERDWVAGIIARGFYPAVALQDSSISIHGKPAADLLAYWYPRLTGMAEQN